MFFFNKCLRRNFDIFCIILINAPKKVFKCEIPINITPLECFQLYLKSKKPIKVTKSYWEQLFQQGNAEFIAKKKFPGKKKFLKKIFLTRKNFRRQKILHFPVETIVPSNFLSL